MPSVVSERIFPNSIWKYFDRHPLAPQLRLICTAKPFVQRDKNFTQEHRRQGVPNIPGVPLQRVALFSLIPQKRLYMEPASPQIPCSRPGEPEAVLAALSEHRASWAGGWLGHALLHPSNELGHWLFGDLKYSMAIVGVIVAH